MRGAAPLQGAGPAASPRGAALARRIEPYFAHDAAVTLETALDDDVDQQVQQALDVRARESAAAGALLDEQHQLLEGEFGAAWRARW